MRVRPYRCTWASRVPIHRWMCIDAHARIRICTRVCVCIHVHRRPCTCAYVHRYPCVCVDVYVRAREYLSVYLCTYKYTHRHTQTYTDIHGRNARARVCVCRARTHARIYGESASILPKGLFCPKAIKASDHSASKRETTPDERGGQAAGPSRHLPSREREHRQPPRSTR